MMLLQVGVIASIVVSASACTTSSAVRDDGNVSVAVVEAANLTCGWLIRSSSPPTKERMESLGWRQWMTRADAVGMPPTLGGQKLDPALAGYRLRFGETGDIIASYWENRCYGVLSNDLLPDDDPRRVQRGQLAVVALEAWIMAQLPDATHGQLDFTAGEERPHVARADRRFAFSAVMTRMGGVEWRLTPNEMLAARAAPVDSKDETLP